jgi:hypothetical protein
MTSQPIEGRCELCSQQRPLFDLNFTADGQKQAARLCTRCHSHASAMAPARLAEDLFFAIGGAR